MLATLAEEVVGISPLVGFFSGVPVAGALFFVVQWMIRNCRREMAEQRDFFMSVLEANLEPQQLANIADNLRQRVNRRRLRQPEPEPER